MNRLKTVAEPGGKTTNYSFDAAGNRSAETVVESSVTTVTNYSYDTRNRLTATEKTVRGLPAGGTDYYNDNNGNMISV